MQPALCLQPQPIHLRGLQPHQSWGSFLWHSPSHASRNPCQRSHQRGKLSPSWFSQAWVCGESSLPSPTPLTLCWRSPRTDPSSVAPCRTTGQPSHSCLERVQPCQAAWRVLHPMCFLGERKKNEISWFCRAVQSPGIQLEMAMDKENPESSLQEQSPCLGQGEVQHTQDYFW